MSIAPWCTGGSACPPIGTSLFNHTNTTTGLSYLSGTDAPQMLHYDSTQSPSDNYSAITNTTVPTNWSFDALTAAGSYVPHHHHFGKLRTTGRSIYIAPTQSAPSTAPTTTNSYTPLHHANSTETPSNPLYTDASTYDPPTSPTASSPRSRSRYSFSPPTSPPSISADNSSPGRSYSALGWLGGVSALGSAMCGRTKSLLSTAKEVLDEARWTAYVGAGAAAVGAAVLGTGTWYLSSVWNGRAGASAVSGVGRRD